MSLTREATGTVVVTCDGKPDCRSWHQLSRVQTSGDRLRLDGAKMELRKMGWIERPGDRAGDDARWFCSVCRPEQVTQSTPVLLDEDDKLDLEKVVAALVGLEVPREADHVLRAAVYLIRYGGDAVEKERDRLRAMLLWLGQTARVKGTVAIVAGEDGAEDAERERVGVAVMCNENDTTTLRLIEHCEGGTLERAIDNYIAHLPPSMEGSALTAEHVDAAAKYMRDQGGGADETP